MKNASRTPEPSQPSYRSGAVARMAGMPVATLRIWEQRYQAVSPTTAASGHRLYSAVDVERVTLLRRLTGRGHTISLLAPLSNGQLRAMLREQTAAGSSSTADRAARPATMKVIVVGYALSSRLRQLELRHPHGPLLHQIGVFESLSDATQAADRVTETDVDLLLWQSGSLQSGASQDLRSAQDAWRARAAAVIYRYSNAAARAELIGAGAMVVREPVDDEDLEQWLACLGPQPATANAGPRGHGMDQPGILDLLKHPPTDPRFAELALIEFAGFSSGIACECPTHLAQLLLQITSFETYSRECSSRSARDAQLHRYLQKIAGAARMLFESALERVAVAEGLPLPHAPGRQTLPDAPGTSS